MSTFIKKLIDACQDFESEIKAHEEMLQRQNDAFIVERSTIVQLLLNKDVSDAEVRQRLIDYFT